jgi:hypothetical protein
MGGAAGGDNGPGKQLRRSMSTAYLGIKKLVSFPGNEMTQCIAMHNVAITTIQRNKASCSVCGSLLDGFAHWLRRHFFPTHVDLENR